MKYKQLGTSDLHISVLSFGCWQMGDKKFWGDTDEAEASDTAHAAIDSGINFFDTAEVYGNGLSEEVLGRALGSKRKDLIVASKFLPTRTDPAAVRKACDDSLKRLGTDYLDLYQIHWPMRDVSLDDICAELESLKDAGKIRYVGLSNYGPRDMKAWMDAGPVISDQVAYSLLFRAIEGGIVPACADHGLGILAYMPVMQGLLADRFQSAEEVPPMRRRSRHFSPDREETRHTEAGAEDLTFETIAAIRSIVADIGQPMATVALAWVMAQPGITSTIIGGRSREQLTQNLAALDLTLDEGVLTRLDEATSAIRAHFGDNADLWDSGEASRVR
jgi:aryl-alcohol dehydrogenase-like predicted oxidoreductase